VTHSYSAPLSDDVALKLQSLQQGDVLPDITILPVRGADGTFQLDAPAGVVILSQTCDVVRETLPYLHVGPRKLLSDNDARLARRGRRPRYVHLPEIGETEFVDLANIGSIHKALVAQASSVRGVSSDAQISRFGKAVGRYFNRFAYPGDVNRFLKPLADAIQSKSGNLESAEGRRIEEVLQLRIESLNGWLHAPYDLRLSIIVHPGALPTFENDELPPFDEGLQRWLYNTEGTIQQSPHTIAERLDATVDAAARYYLWSALGDAWANRCSAKHMSTTLTAEVVSSDEFSLTRMLQSELLDLDHLSTPDGQPT